MAEKSEDAKEALKKEQEDLDTKVEIPRQDKFDMHKLPEDLRVGTIDGTSTSFKSVRDAYKRISYRPKYAVPRKLKESYEKHSALYATAALFVAGMLAFGGGFKTVDKCKNDVGTIVTLFFAFVGVASANFYFHNPISGGKTHEAQHSLLLMLFCAMVYGVVFYCGRLWIECSEDPEKDDDLKAVNLLAQLALLAATVFVAQALFHIDLSGTLALSAVMLQFILMAITGVYPFHSWKTSVNLRCPASKQCMQEESDPDVIKGWFKKFFRTKDKNGVSCERRSETKAGRALASALIGDNGVPHSYFSVDKLMG